MEVIATDANGTRVAIEHTRLFAFEDHKLQEELLRPIAECLEAEPQLRIAGQRFDLRFQGKFLGRLRRKDRPLVQRELQNWAIRILPGLPISSQCQFDVSIHLPRGKVAKIPVEIEVSERDESMRSVSVGGYLLPDPKRLVPIVRRALRDKLPKLVATRADLRILLLELPITTDSPSKVIDTVRELAAQFPALERIDYIVAANTFAWELEGYILFWVWDRGADDWSDILQPIVAPPVDNGWHETRNG